MSCFIYILPTINIFLDIIIKLIIAALFPFILLAFKFYEPAELEILKSPAKIMEFVKGTFGGAKEVPVDSETMIEK